LGGGIWGMPVYFNGTLYGARGWRCEEGFQGYQRRLSAGPILQTSNTFCYPGNDSQHFGKWDQ